MKEEKLYKMAKTEDGIEYLGVSFIGLSKSAQIETKPDDYRADNKTKRFDKPITKREPAKKKVSKIIHARKQEQQRALQRTLAEEQVEIEELEYVATDLTEEEKAAIALELLSAATEAE